MERIKQFEVAILPKDADCSELNERNADFFYTAWMYSEPLLKKVVSEFEDALKEEAGLDGKVLKATKEKTVTRGDITFKLTATPSPRTSYMEVGRAIDQYLTDLQEANDAGVKREGIKRFEDKAYISIDEVVEKMNSLIQTNTNVTTNFSIDYTKLREDPAKTGRLIFVEPGTYGNVTEQNAITYRLAKEQLKLLGSKVTKPFNAALKAETGYDVKHLPVQTTKDSFGVGKYIFMVTSIPKTDVEYGKAAKEFIQHVKDCQENSEGIKEREGMDWIAIDDLVKEYRTLIATNTKPAIEQRIDLFPNPKYDHILVSF